MAIQWSSASVVCAITYEVLANGNKLNMIAPEQTAFADAGALTMANLSAMLGDGMPTQGQAAQFYGTWFLTWIQKYHNAQKSNPPLQEGVLSKKFVDVFGNAKATVTDLAVTLDQYLSFAENLPLPVPPADANLADPSKL